MMEKFEEEDAKKSGNQAYKSLSLVYTSDKYSLDFHF
jgi:hypothetical protein